MTTTAFVASTYSNNLRKGIWSFMIGSPVHGGAFDEYSTMSHFYFEFMSILQLFKSVQEGTLLIVKTSNKMVMSQLTMSRRINHASLQELYKEISNLQSSKNLHVTYEYIPRAENPLCRHINENLFWFMKEVKAQG